MNRTTRRPADGRSVADRSRRSVQTGKESESAFRSFCRKQRCAAIKTKHLFWYLKRAHWPYPTYPITRWSPAHKKLLRHLCDALPSCWRQAITEYSNRLSTKPWDGPISPARGLPDYCVFKAGSPLVFVEVKSRPQLSLTRLQKASQRYFSTQGIRFDVWWPGCIQIEAMSSSTVEES